MASGGARTFGIFDSSLGRAVDLSKEAKVLAKGRAKPSRRFELVQNWEQRRRNPTGLAAALLRIVATAPEVALKSLHG